MSVKVQALIPELTTLPGIKRDCWRTVFESDDEGEAEQQADMARRFYVNVRVVE
jgi:hypothetical protein